MVLWNHIQVISILRRPVPKAYLWIYEHAPLYDGHGSVTRVTEVQQLLYGRLPKAARFHDPAFDLRCLEHTSCLTG